jgi:type IV pilus assembly protein PilB
MPYFVIVNSADKSKSIHPVDKKLAKIGRLSDNDIILRDQRVSRYHAEVIHQENGDYLLKDLYSSNGVKINGQQISAKILEDKDKIKIGGFLMLFKKGKLSQNTLDHLEKTAIAVSSETVTRTHTDPPLDPATELALTDDFRTLAQEPEKEQTTEFITERPTKTVAPATETSIPPVQESVPPKVTGYRAKENNLLQLLFKNGIITENELQDSMRKVRESSATICQTLTKMSLSNRRGFIDTLKSYFGLPYIETDDEITKMYQKTTIGESVFRRCNALSISSKDSTDKRYIPVIMSDPTDLQAIDELTIAAKKTVKPVCISTAENIKKAISRVFKSNLESRFYGMKNITVEIGKRDYSVEEVSDFPVVDMVNYFIHKAMIERASDVHFEPTEHFFVVRNRIDGVLHEVAALPHYIHPEIVSRLKIICDMNVAERRLPQDGRFSVSIQDKKLDVRVSTIPTVHGEKVVLRLLESSAMISDIDHLGMMDHEKDLFMEKIKAPYGIILLTGPTGSGKTTTLYSALSTLNSGNTNIVTVEDPVEYKMPGIYQIQANDKIGLNFASGLRTILRQDPDVIMVGEIRDQETAQIAIRSALTGHIVFSTLHTNDAIGIVLRLTDMGIDPFLVSSALTLAVAQRLYRTICEDCKSYIESEIVWERLDEEGITESRLTKLGISISGDREYAVGKGCPKCRGTGYFGRQALFEMFNVTQEAKNMLTSKDFTETALKKLATKQGMSTLLHAGRRAVEQGMTTVEEIIRVCGED